MKYISMHLNAAIALKGFANLDDVETLVERIRDELHVVDSNIATVGLELLAVGTAFGVTDDTTIHDLIATAEQLRRRLLRDFWLHHHRNKLYDSLRLAHAIATMNPDRLSAVIDRIENSFPGL